MNPTLRLTFSRTGTAKYISHLDMQRTMQRALKRAEIPIWYSEGFNPHPYLSFVCPLPVGVEGEKEMVDFRLADNMTGEEICRRLNQVFPQGFSAESAFPPQDKARELAYAKYTVTFDKSMKDHFFEFWSEKALPVIKKTKRAEKEIDLKQKLCRYEITEKHNSFSFSAFYPCSSEETLNPNLLIKAFEAHSGETGPCQIVRNSFYKADFTIFQ